MAVAAVVVVTAALSPVCWVLCVGVAVVTVVERLWRLPRRCA